MYEIILITWEHTKKNLTKKLKKSFNLEAKKRLNRKLIENRTMNANQTMSENRRESGNQTKMMNSLMEFLKDECHPDKQHLILVIPVLLMELGIQSLASGQQEKSEDLLEQRLGLEQFELF